MKSAQNQLSKYLLLVILIALTLISIILYLGAKSELDTLKTDYKKQIDAHKLANKELVNQNSRLMEAAISKALDAPINAYGWNEKELKKKGLSNPVKDLIADLIKHPELIPYDGVLGGTMGFFPSECRVINNKWIFGYFEDGHIGGSILLEYSVAENGKISWKRIVSTK